MGHEPSSILKPWENFYVIIGSSAAALTGLVFVVITIVSGSDRVRRSREGTRTFTTPTVVHFGAALLASASLSIPWPSLFYVSIVFALLGLFGVGYVLRVAYRIRRMTTYDADTEDWIWHTLMPLLAYGAILAGAVALPALAAEAMFAFAFAVIVLTFTGVHNAWDIVTFIAVENSDPAPTETPADDEKKADA